LIEVVIVIAIIATIAAISIPSIVTKIEKDTVKVTKEKMANLAAALNNYYDDVGEYPSIKDLTDDGRQLVNDKGIGTSLDFLVRNPYPQQGTSIRDTIRHYRWNGPYLTASFHKDDYKKDAWGRAIYYEPQYGRSRAESANGQQYAGAEDLPANAVMLASMGKTPGWGFRDASAAASGGPTLGMLTWRELTKFIPYSELKSKKYEHILKDNIIRIVNPADIDRRKQEETEKRFDEIRRAICGWAPEDYDWGGCLKGFVPDLGVSVARGSDTGTPRVPLDTDDFRDFDNPLELLIMRYVDPSSKDLYYGAPRDVPPPYRTGDPGTFNVRKGDLDYSWMGWGGPYIDDAGESYTNENDDIITTYDCFIDAWCNPIRLYHEGEAYAGAVLDLEFGNRPEDQDVPYYAEMAGLIASPGPNRIFDRMTSGALDPKMVRAGGNPGGMLPSEGEDDEDVFVPLYKRDLWANIAPDTVIEAMDKPSSINTPVDIEIAYNTRTLPSVPDYISGIAVIYPDPQEAAGFNVVELMGSGSPIEITSPTNQHIHKDSFTKIDSNQFIPVGHAFFYIKVVQHRDIGSQDTGYCPALRQRLGWEEVAWTGITQTQIYGRRACVAGGGTPISVEFTLLGGG